MKIRALSIAVIVLSLAICGISAVKIAARVTQLRNQVLYEAGLRTAAETDLAQTSGELRKTKENLRSTAEKLESTQAEKKTAILNLTAQKQRAEKLADQLTETKSALDQLVAESARLRNDDPHKLLDPMKENTELKAKVSQLQKSYAKVVKRVQQQAQLLGDPCDGFELPENFNGKITAVDPKWSFVVLGVGETQGAVTDGEILINRSGKLLAKAKITRVSETQSIANLLPGYSVGQVTEGDTFLAAR